MTNVAINGFVPTSPGAAAATGGEVVDLGMRQVVDGDLVKVMSWYDNEWGYSNQLVRQAVRIAGEIARQRVRREP